MRRPTGTDDSLIQAAVRGNSAAFSELVRRHRPWVCRLLRSFTTDTELAEDLAQEVFTRLHRHGASYQRRGNFVAYLKQVALNVGRSHLRSTRGVTFISWDEASAEALSGTDLLDDVLGRGVHAAVRAAIETLPTEQREAVLLHYFAGLTVPEIAAHVQCPAGTIKSRLFHGIRKVRATVVDWEQDSPNTENQGTK